MSKLFTLAEAQVLLPVLDSLLRRAHAAAERANDLEREMQQLSHRIFLTGGMHVNVAAAARTRASREKALQEGKDTVEEIAAIGVKIQDFAAGILDFPCIVEGRTVLLCWKLGEPAIAHWHEEDEDAQYRRPVETLFGKTERERLN
jgi:hypothetical protein